MEEVRVQYCIPNIHAINIYMNFVNNPMERVEKKALMDETPSKDVYQQLECLAKQNPWFVQSLRSIMTQNILAGDLASLISSMTSLVSQGKLASQPPTSAVTPNTKNPQLMNMLYSAFQARMSKLQHHNAEPEKAGSPTSPSQVSPTPAPTETSEPPAPA